MNDQRVEAFLAHHGVVGMHWGKHKEKVTSDDIRDARGRQRERFKQLRSHLEAADDATSHEEKAKHLSEIHRIAKEGLESGDADVASAFTTRDKVAAGLAGGAVPGLVALSAAGSINRRHQNALLKSYARTKESDVGSDPRSK
jgi:hypothetical protein